MTSTVKSQRVRRAKEDARQEILNAAEDALAELAFGKLTVDAVMQRTSMTRSSFYHYFSGMDDIALGLLERFEQDIRASVNEWLMGLTDEVDYQQATATHLTNMFHAIHAHRTAHAAVAQAISHGHVYEAWQKRIVGYFVDLTTRFIERQIELGYSRVSDPARMANALILMNNAVVNDNLARALPDTPEELGNTTATIWNAAIYRL